MVIVSKISFKKKDLGVFSPLEHDVINVLWQSSEGQRVRDIYKKVRKKKKIALTSVAVTLDRLYDRKFVKRTTCTGRGGEHYIYSCACCKEIFQKSVIEKTVNELIDSFGPVAHQYLKERFSKKK